MELVVLSLEPWDEVWRRNQLMVRELVAADAGLRVLFVEPPLDANPLSRNCPRVPEQVYEFEQVWRFRPTKVLPRSLGVWADRLLARQLVGALQVLGFSQPIYWINDVNWVGLHTLGPTLYDITDDWTAEASVPSRVRRRRKRRERLLLDVANSVVACSEEIVRRKSGARVDIKLIPNAVDVAHFARRQPRPLDLPAGRVALYVGTLHSERIDVALLRQVAERTPLVTFVLLGPDCLTPALREHLDLPNIVILGPRPYTEVPGYMQHADLIFVPHLDNDFTRSLDPIKAYECMAAARPVVATAIPGFTQIPEWRIVGNATEAVRAIRELIECPSVSSACAPPSWSDRAREFREAIEQAAIAGRPRRID